jgi:thiamine pyrophosphokinase
MSSHHIVREKQEPALLVLGLDNFDDELLGQLLEWSPTLIATPQTAEKLNAYGIKIDWIITDGQHDEVLQSDVKLMSSGSDNLTETALKYLTTYEYPAVNIVTDELHLADYEPYADKLNLVIFHANKKIYPINPGFSKWKPLGEKIQLITSIKNLQTTGLESMGNDHYQTIADGFFTIHFDAPFLFIAEEL